MRWEYCLLVPTTAHEGFINKLNQYGADGWEAVAVMDDGTTILKRPKDEPVQCAEPHPSPTVCADCSLFNGTRCTRGIPPENTNPKCEQPEPVGLWVDEHQQVHANKGCVVCLSNPPLQGFLLCESCATSIKQAIIDAKPGASTIDTMDVCIKWTAEHARTHERNRWRKRHPNPTDKFESLAAAIATMFSDGRSQLCAWLVELDHRRKDADAYQQKAQALQIELDRIGETTDNLIRWAKSNKPTTPPKELDLFKHGLQHAKDVIINTIGHHKPNQQLKSDINQLCNAVGTTTLANAINVVETWVGDMNRLHQFILTNWVHLGDPGTDPNLDQTVISLAQHLLDRFVPKQVQ